MISVPSKRLIARSSAFWRAALILWAINLFRSIDLPSSWMCRCLRSVSYLLAEGYGILVSSRAHSARNLLSKTMLEIFGKSSSINLHRKYFWLHWHTQITTVNLNYFVFSFDCLNTDRAAVWKNFNGYAINLNLMSQCTLGTPHIIM